jgi:hypothetical protein
VQSPGRLQEAAVSGDGKEGSSLVRVHGL